METMDKNNSKFGKGSLRLRSELMSTGWHMTVMYSVHALPLDLMIYWMLGKNKTALTGGIIRVIVTDLYMILYDIL